jgi:TRAP-type C4-dicarboxylate transport system permease small subunit
MKTLGTAFDRLEDALAVVAAALLVLSVLLVTGDVVLRFFFTRPLAWVFEVTEYILLFVPCLGMAWLARNDGHIVIDVVTSQLSPRTRAVLGGWVALTVAALCAFIAWWGVIATREAFVAKAMIENVLQMPQYIPYAFIPFGFALCAVEYIRKAVLAWTPGPDK